MAKELKPNEKSALVAQLALLLDYNEPSAMLAMFQRIAELRAYSGAQHVDYDHAMRWQTLAAALATVRAELERRSPLVTDI